MAKLLPVINSEKFAIVDDEDFEWASKYTWRKGPHGHVVRDGLDANGNKKIFFLSIEVIGRATGQELECCGFSNGAPRMRRVKHKGPAW